MNCLLLATRESPREAVMDGTLDSFWADAREWNPGSAAMQALNPLGLTPSFDGDSTFELQHKYFGDLKMRDLKQNVLISTYDWHGRPSHPEMAEKPVAPPTDPFARSMAFWQGAAEAMRQNLADITHDAGEQTGYCGDPHVQRERFRHWGPTHFARVPDPSKAVHGMMADRSPPTGAGMPLHEREDLDYYVTNVAYVAQTPPVARPYRFGLGDGASASLSPAGLALSWTYDYLRKVYAAQADASGDTMRALPVEIMSILSVGDGSQIPFHWERASNFNGAHWFQKWPTNPATGAWWSPSAYQFQGGAEEDNQVVGRLLSERFYRLNPGLMQIPMVNATFACGNPIFRNWIESEIDRQAKSPLANKALDECARWMATEGWTQNYITR